MNQGKTVAFVETLEDVRAASAAKPDVVVAAAPEAAEAMTQAGLPWVAQEDLYDERRLKVLAEETLLSHRAWADALESDLLAKVPEFAQEGFRPLQAHYLPLKMASDALLLRSHVLTASLDQLDPVHILHPKSARLLPHEDLLFRDSLLGRILPSLARARDVRATAFEAAADFSRPPRPWGPRLAGLPRKLLSLATRRKPSPSASGPLILLGAGYDTAFLREPLERRGARIEEFSRWMEKAPLPQPGLLAAGLAGWRAASTRCPSPPGLASAGLASEFQERWELWRDVIVPRAWATFLKAGVHARREGAAAIVLPMTTGADDVAALQALRRSGTKAVHFQHGGFNGTCAYSGWEVSDLVDFDAILTYGQGVIDHYAPRARRFGLSPRFEGVGSPRIDSLLAMRRPRRPSAHRGPRSVLFYIDMYKGPTRYLCGEAMPDVHAYRIHRRVIEAFSRRPEHRYEFRDLDGFYPNPLRDFFHQSVPGGRIHRSGTLFEAALRSDLVIADMPSTGLLEVLAAGAPVLLLADSTSLTLLPRAARALARSVSLTEDADSFLAAVESALSGSAVPPSPAPDGEYLKDFGTSRGDGRSAERAADAVLSLAGDHA